MYSVGECRIESLPDRTRRFVLYKDGVPLACMNIELITGSVIKINTPDKALIENEWEMLVRSALNAAANTGLDLVTECAAYIKFGFKERDGLYYAGSADIVFPKLCRTE